MRNPWRHNLTVLICATGLLFACGSDGEDATSGRQEFLFTQTAQGGTFTPAGDGTWQLDLTDVYPQTFFFSDRPERIAGQVGVEKFLLNLDFPDPDDPPNAAIVLSEANAAQDVVIGELLDPTYDKEAATLSYRVRVLPDSPSTALDGFAGDRDPALAQEFGDVSVFIDDCSDSVFCVDFNNCQFFGKINGGGSCWEWKDLACVTCDRTRALKDCRGPEGNGCGAFGDECQAISGEEFYGGFVVACR